ncbi:hypothetical protein [Clostridium estertheticum]|uniref:hypothetical protein n=1 Tax=Clostridium estertheticum TaxID=238834 RepID=UPI001C0B0983|nr:hypothetical protein [Clostridium estertheticum]MBU3186558.1 hypothetical protein [Clostridium estertheticum]
MKLFSVDAWNGEYYEDMDVKSFLVAFETEKEAKDYVLNKANEDQINDPNNIYELDYSYEDIEVVEVTETDNGYKLGII